MTVIGDSQPAAKEVVVGALPISVVTLAELSAVADPVNLKLYSGKKIGAMYAYLASAGVMEVVIAAGSEPTDKWTKLSDGLQITPA